MAFSKLFGISFKCVELAIIFSMSILLYDGFGCYGNNGLMIGVDDCAPEYLVVVGYCLFVAPASLYMIHT